MSDTPFTPYQVLEVELSRPLPDLRRAADYTVQRVLALVRLHSYPLGVVELEVSSDVLPADQFAAEIWRELGPQINAHLQQDHLAQVDGLDARGLDDAGQPACQEARRRLLQDAPFASVIVATRDRLETLAPCLESLLAQEYPNFDIVVVDNAPSDERTAEFIRSTYAGSDRVRYAREDRPGLACAHNRGLEETGAPYLVITDDDVIADRYWLVEMMLGFRQDGALAGSRVGCVTGMIFPAEIQTQAQYLVERSVGYAKGYSPRLFHRKSHRPDSPLFPYAAGMFGSGANMAFDSAALREMGGFDNSLGAGSVALGGDDLAAFFDVVSAGYGLVYQPSAIIYHRHHREYERLRKTAYGYGAGLTAYLTKTIIDRPTRVFDIARRVPQGMRHALSPNSDKNARKTEDYPKELTRIERKGMLAGPLLYLRSRWKTRGWRGQLPKSGEKASQSAEEGSIR
jgi:O-antigen biosynthesis protein